MVCVYCAHETQVINSRHQKKANQVWRRRKCLHCQAIFTTIEATDATQALRLRRKTRLEPFSRDTLLLSVYDSLKHRKTAATDATGITTTILGLLYPLATEAVIERDVVVELVRQVLKRFDKAAAVHYQAFHPN
jgi:transcriptional repressor NrdR